MNRREWVLYGQKELEEAQIENASGDAWYLFSECFHISREDYLFGMIDEINDKEAEERYKQVAKGKIPDNIKEINISNETREINICDLLVKTGFAPSKSEAKRMIQGKGVKINSNIVDNLGENIVLEEPIVLQFGKNKFIKVV